MTKIIRAHKIRLRPTEEQKQHLFRGFAASRHAWNFGKEILDTEYDINRVLYRDHGENYKFTSPRRLKKLYNKVKPAWVKDRTSTATQEAFDDLNRAVRRYFDIRSGKIKINLKTDENGKVRPRRDRRHHGWLNWRNRRDHNSFRATNNGFKLKGLHIRYNAQVGYIRLCEQLRFEGKLMNATFSYDGQWFWAAIQVEIDLPEVEPQPGAVGVHLGVRHLAVGSDPITRAGGQRVENPKAYAQAQAKLRRLQRKLDRQRRANNPDNYKTDGTVKKGRREWIISNRMERTNQAIKRLHARIKHIRHDAHHQLTANVAQNYGLIVIQDLDVNQMLKQPRFAKHIADAGLGNIRRQLEYKAEFNGGRVGLIDREFPAARQCSGCGSINTDLTPAKQRWVCAECEQAHDRSLNAAINLKNEGVRLFVDELNENRP